MFTVVAKPHHVMCTCFICGAYVWVGPDAAVQYQKLQCAVGNVSRDAKQDETFWQETAGEPYL